MLNRRKLAFIEHYLQCYNATEAAKRAGYSEKTAYSKGHALLKRIEISEIIDKKNAELTLATEIKREEIVRNLKKEAETAPKPSDRIRANEVLAKIGALFKESEQNISIFNVSKEVERRGINRLNMLNVQEQPSNN